jgi:hypothetical protein
VVSEEDVMIDDISAVIIEVSTEGDDTAALSSLPSLGTENSELSVDGEVSEPHSVDRRNDVWRSSIHMPNSEVNVKKF